MKNTKILIATTAFIFLNGSAKYGISNSEFTQKTRFIEKQQEVEIKTPNYKPKKAKLENSEKEEPKTTIRKLKGKK